MGQSRTKTKIRRGDIVEAITGEDAAGKKTGKVLHIFPERQRAVVEGLNMAKKHLRKSQDNPEGGIIEKEAPIHLSNLRVVERAESKDKKPKKTKKTK